MPHFLFMAALAALVAATPAFAQTVETVTKAAVEGAVEGAANALTGDHDRRPAAKKKAKEGPNLGRSEAHRQDGAHANKAKGKAKQP